MIPNRSASYRGSLVAAISIAQHMIPKWRGHVEFRFAQLKKSPTMASRSFRIGPFFNGASMFRSTHLTKSWDFRPMMFACSAGWIIAPSFRVGPRRADAENGAATLGFPSASARDSMATTRRGDINLGHCGRPKTRRARRCVRPAVVRAHRPTPLGRVKSDPAGRAPPREVRVVPVNPERIRKLRDFGLTEYQARVYLALLDLGNATASQIPAISRVPRTRIYATMQQLHEKGLVEIIPETPLKYTPVPFSSYLATRAQEQREKAEQLEATLPQLGAEFAITGGQPAGGAGRGRPEVRVPRHGGQLEGRRGAPAVRGGPEHRLPDARVPPCRGSPGIPDDPPNPGRRVLVPRGGHRDLDERRGDRRGDARDGGDDLLFRLPPRPRGRPADPPAEGLRGGGGARCAGWGRGSSLPAPAPT